jgi:hypothetical protein
MAASDKHQLRTDVAEFLDDLLNRSNEHRLVAVSRKSIGEVDPNIHVRLHNHHGRSNIVLPVRHRKISYCPAQLESVALSAQCLASPISRRLGREGSEHMDRT